MQIAYTYIPPARSSGPREQPAPTEGASGRRSVGSVGGGGDQCTQEIDTSINTAINTHTYTHTHTHTHIHTNN